MGSQVAVNFPPEVVAQLLVEHDVTALLFKNGKFFRVRMVTSVNNTKEEVRFIPHSGSAETLPIAEIAEISID